MVYRPARALTAALSLTLALAGATACKRPPAPAVTTSVTALDAQHEPLRARFDADADVPRLLVLASPT